MRPLTSAYTAMTMARTVAAAKKTDVGVRRADGMAATGAAEDIDTPLSRESGQPRDYDVAS
ncbi:hypothetical protein GCM10007298_16100 [Williamsia phyllosphaerae]|uniref:Uncharacterized protein n=1 Tax=Williamsia phyllosphaerae TaxID=885042 RepID=A0ABQ1UK17_9NOCA|nr:hypothetical protein GCM10007298_16100 [Williamsia phyllosphaerae]